MSTNTKVVTSQDILLKLCSSICDVLGAACNKQVEHAHLIQSINRTTLKPDIGCFVVFDGGFSGLVVINFSADAAMEIYKDYMLAMGMPESELATQYLADDVSNVMGELMNQIVGEYTGKISKKLQTQISQSQPKMLTINKQLNISIDANLDDPIFKRVAFKTHSGNVFYLEFAVDNTEFTVLDSFAEEDELDPDAVLEQMAGG